MLHYANISLKLGNKQLEIDVENESVKNNQKANELARNNYRKGFELNEIV
jgi:hypothetical protein